MFYDHTGHIYFWFIMLTLFMWVQILFLNCFIITLVTFIFDHTMLGFCAFKRAVWSLFITLVTFISNPVCLYLLNGPLEWLLWIALIITIITNTEKEMAFGLRIRGWYCMPSTTPQACLLCGPAIPVLCLFNLFLFINKLIFVAHANLSNFIQWSVRAFIFDPYNPLSKYLSLLLSSIRAQQLSLCLVMATLLTLIFDTNLCLACL